MNSANPYEGDQGHTLVLLLPGGPLQLGGAEVAAVSSDQAAWQAAQADITAKAETHAAWEFGKGKLTSSAQVDVGGAGNNPGEIRQCSDGPRLAWFNSFNIQVVQVFIEGHSANALAEVGVGIPDHRSGESAEVCAEFEEAVVGPSVIPTSGHERVVPSGFETIAAVRTECSCSGPSEVVGIFQNVFHLQQSLQGAETVVVSRLPELHETAVAVSKGAGERPAFADWIGVGERSHLAAHFKFAIGVEFQEQQRCISAFDQSLLQKGGDTPPFPAADIAVVAE